MWQDVVNWYHAHQLLVGTAITWFVISMINGVVKEESKVKGAQYFWVPFMGALIYYWGHKYHVSKDAWYASLPVLIFGMWRFFIALEPKVWSAKVEAVTNKVTDEAGLHWAGLAGCVIFHASLVWMIWNPSLASFVFGSMGVVGGWILSCFYNPNLRQRWVIFVFKKPRYAFPDLEELEDNDPEEARYEAMIREEMGLRESRLWNILLRRQRWMDHGLNRNFLPSWFPTLDIGILRCEKLEINGPDGDGIQTAWLPTRPELVERDDDGDPKTFDVRKGTKTPGPQIQLNFKLTGYRHDPRPFLTLSDEDRENDQRYQGLIVRYVKAAISLYTRLFTSDEVVAGGHVYESPIAELNDKRREDVERKVRRELLATYEARADAAVVVASAEALSAGRTLSAAEIAAVRERTKAPLEANLEADVRIWLGRLYEPVVLRRNRAEMSSLFDYIAEDLRRHTGFRLTSLEVLDINQEPRIQAALDARKTQEIAVEQAKKAREKKQIEGKAEGEFIALQIEAIAEALEKRAAGRPIDAEKVFAQLTALRLAESGGTVAFPAGFLDRISHLFGGGQS